MTRNARRKGPSIEKLKVYIKVMLIIIPKEREHVRIKSIKSSKQKKPNAHESLPRKDKIIAFFGSTCILENPE